MPFYLLAPLLIVGCGVAAAGIGAAFAYPVTKWYNKVDVCTCNPWSDDECKWSGHLQED